MPDCLTDENPDYCTILPAANRRWLAVRMRYERDEWIIRQSWGPLPKAQAESKAQQWASTERLEYRP